MWQKDKKIPYNNLLFYVPGTGWSVIYVWIIFNIYFISFLLSAHTYMHHVHYVKHITFVLNWWQLYYTGKYEFGDLMVKEWCSKGLIQNKLSQNSVQSMSFLFFIIFTWYVISDLNMFPIYLSIATKEVGIDKVRSRWGAPRAWFKISRVKILSKVCPFYSLLSSHGMLLVI